MAKLVNVASGLPPELLKSKPALAAELAVRHAAITTALANVLESVVDITVLLALYTPKNKARFVPVWRMHRALMHLGHCV